MHEPHRRFSLEDLRFHAAKSILLDIQNFCTHLAFIRVDEMQR